MGLLNRIEEMEKELAELKSKVKEGPKFPEYEDTYWCIDSEGIVYVNTFEGIQADRNILEIGNMFKTKEQAEFVVEKLKVEAELRKFSRTPDVNGVNWFIVCADVEEIYTLYTTQEISQGVIYFESKKVAQQAIKSVGEERIKKYIFEVE